MSGAESAPAPGTSRSMRNLGMIGSAGALSPAFRSVDHQMDQNANTFASRRGLGTGERGGFGDLFLDEVAAVVGKLEGVEGGGAPLGDADDHIGISRPGGVLEIVLRGPGGVIGMGVIEADHVQAALARLPLHGEVLLGIEVEAVARRLGV